VRILVPDGVADGQIISISLHKVEALPLPLLVCLLFR
jgi:hypothetical protein